MKQVAFCLLLLVGLAYAKICMKGRASVYEPKKQQQCGYHNLPASEDFTSLLKHGLAIQQLNWKSASACGMCYEISGPSSEKPVVFTVTDLCRRNNQWCSGKDKIFHVSMPEKTSWQVIANNVNATAVYTKFKLVACPVQGNLKLQIVEGSTKEKFGIRPFNHRYGVKSVHIMQRGKLKKTKRSADNVFWIVTKGNRRALPVTIEITSSRNQKIRHTITEIKSGIITLAQQFPMSDKRTSRCAPFVDQIIYSDGLSKGVEKKQVAQDWRVLFERNVTVDYESSAMTPRSGSKSIRAQFNKDGLFAMGTASVTSTQTVKGIRFYVASATPLDNVSFFVVNREGKASKTMQVASQGNSTWTKQFFEFSEYIPDWTEFRGLGFTASSSATLYIDDIWLYLNNNLKVGTKSSIMSVNE